MSGTVNPSNGTSAMSAQGERASRSVHRIHGSLNSLAGSNPRSRSTHRRITKFDTIRCRSWGLLTKTGFWHEKTPRDRGAFDAAERSRTSTPCGYKNLNLARSPIPPRPRGTAGGILCRAGGNSSLQKGSKPQMGHRCTQMGTGKRKDVRRKAPSYVYVFTFSRRPRWFDPPSLSLRSSLVALGLWPRTRPTSLPGSTIAGRRTITSSPIAGVRDRPARQRGEKPPPARPSFRSLRPRRKRRPDAARLPYRSV